MAAAFRNDNDLNKHKPLSGLGGSAGAVGQGVRQGFGDAIPGSAVGEGRLQEHFHAGALLPLLSVAANFVCGRFGECGAAPQRVR